jgi:hypothetical protein
MDWEGSTGAGAGVDGPRFWTGADTVVGAGTGAARPVGDPSHRAQNWIRSLPAAEADPAGSRMSGVVWQVSQWRSVNVHPLSIYSPSWNLSRLFHFD